MRNAIFKRFMFVTGVVMLLFGIVIYYRMGNTLVKSTKEQMFSALHIMDYTLDYNDRMHEQLRKMQKVYGQESRFTVISLDGKVCADTQIIETELLENHLEREEIKQAVETGKGYAIRHSETTQQDMLYVALCSKSGGYVLRLAVPFRGYKEFSKILIPSFFIGALVTLLVALVLSDRLAKSIAKPLSKMAGTLFIQSEEKENTPKETYVYPELEIIAESLRQSEQCMNQYIKQLKKEKKIRQEFFTNASHELKTPITSIRGYAELLNVGMVQDAMQQRDFLNRIMKETDHMTGLINNILQISSLEAKETEIVKAEVKFASLVEDVVHELMPVAKQYQVTLQWSCEPVSMWASEQQIRELFTNLINNGIKYNVPGGTVFVSVKTCENGIRIKVEDTGIGIKEEDRVRIFERFYRVDKGRSKRVSGTGLGLAIVKHIVEYYGGTIQVESEWEKGSTFQIYLPGKSEENVV